MIHTSAYAHTGSGDYRAIAQARVSSITTCKSIQTSMQSCWAADVHTSHWDMPSPLPMCSIPHTVPIRVAVGYQAKRQAKLSCMLASATGISVGQEAGHSAELQMYVQVVRDMLSSLTVCCRPLTVPIQVAEATRQSARQR